MITRTLDSFDFPKIGVSTFSKNWALTDGALRDGAFQKGGQGTDSASDRSGAAKREDRDGMMGRSRIWLDF